MYCRICGKLGLDGERCVYCGSASAKGARREGFTSLDGEISSAAVSSPAPSIGASAVSAPAPAKPKNAFAVAGFWFSMGTFIFICLLSVSQIFLARPEGAFVSIALYNVFIFLSELTGITGLVLSSMGVNKAKRLEGSGKKLAVAGVVIACFVILSVTGQIISIFVNA